MMYANKKTAIHVDGSFFMKTVKFLSMQMKIEVDFSIYEWVISQ